MAKKAIALQKPNTIQLFWRVGDHNTRRVWRSDWPGDTFEILSTEEFAEVKWVCGRFSFLLTEAEED